MVQAISVQPNLQLHCPHCGATISSIDKFCSSCGKAVNEAGVSVGRQIYIYLVSIFLAPLGLIWFFKYFKSPINSNRRIGWIAGVLTILSIVLSLWFGLQFIHSLQSQLNSYSQMGL